MMKRVLGAVMAAAIAVSGAAASADSVSSKSRAKLFKNQTRVLDRRAASQYKHSVRLQPPSIHTPSKFSGPGYSGRYNGPWLSVARQMAQRHGIPEDLFLRLVQQESAWKVKARSHKGAIGLAQLMPGTARSLGVDPHDPRQNLEGGARYLRMMYDRFRSWRLALAAYNAGPLAVEKHGGVPPYRETKNYVRKILGS